MTEATARDGRLTAERHAPRMVEATGLRTLGLADGRDGWLFVPETPDGPPPALAVMFHGAGGNGRRTATHLLELAERENLLVLAPDSRLDTWDVLYGEYGPDVLFLDRALAFVFDRYHVDPSLVAAGGFSDGASYALSLGLTNGDLFSHVIAFSPGFMAPADREGKPDIFVSHGVHDRVLPIDVCSRRLVPQLRLAGYAVTYHEFDGPHTVPPEIAQEAMSWLRTPRR